MKRKLPRPAHLTIGRRLPPAPPKPALVWELRWRSGERLTFLAEGDAATRADARDKAWHALEEIGLVIDE